MTFCISEFTAGGIVSFILLLIGIAIKATLKASALSHSLKLTNNEVATLREKAKMADKPTDNSANIGTPDVSPPSTSNEKINDKQKGILAFLALNKHSHASHISSQIKENMEMILHELMVLEAKGLTTQYWRSETWNITPLGRIYVHDNKLLSKQSN